MDTRLLFVAAPLVIAVSWVLFNAGRLLLIQFKNAFLD
jgi:hypothetical protein|tara:strand:- start:3279 stop:3392 length:114 start_codon:yes stop_codon:yes gene_type:complete